MNEVKKIHKNILEDIIMCEYCDENRLEDFSAQNFKVTPKYGKAWITRDCDGYELNFELDDIIHCAGFKIYHCPICGRELK